MWRYITSKTKLILCPRLVFMASILLSLVFPIQRLEASGGFGGFEESQGGWGEAPPPPPELPPSPPPAPCPPCPPQKVKYIAIGELVRRTRDQFETLLIFCFSQRFPRL